MKKFLKSKLILSVAILTLSSTAAMAYVTKGDIQRLGLDQITLDGTTVTSTGAELNYNDIATLGTLAASKAWTSDASLDTVMPTGGLLTVQSGGAITANSGSTVTVAGTLATTGAVTATGTVTSTRTTGADSATTNKAVTIALTSPVDTTGTNSHIGFDFSPTIGNASGGTNSVIGYNVGNVTGDAQVNVTAVKVGTGTLLGTSNAIDVGSGWDLGLNTASPVANTLAPGADSAATNTASAISFTTPVDTTGTNAHNGLLISGTIGNASGGTNTFDALEIAAITGDAQVTETAIKIGTGFDVGIVTDSSLKVNSTNGTALSAIRIGTDTDLDNGQTSEVVTVTGVTSASLCFATITIDTTTEVSVTSAVAGTDQVTVQVSGDPGASGADLAVICYN